MTHRIELGMFERKALSTWSDQQLIEGYAKSAGYVAGAGALCLAAYGLYWFFDAGWDIGERIKRSLADYWEQASQGNVLYLQPLEVPPEIASGEEESFVKKWGEGSIIDHKWWAALLGL